LLAPLSLQILPFANAFYRGLSDLISPYWLSLFNADEFNQVTLFSFLFFFFLERILFSVFYTIETGITPGIMQEMSFDLTVITKV